MATARKKDSSIHRGTHQAVYYCESCLSRINRLFAIPAASHVARTLYICWLTFNSISSYRWRKKEENVTSCSRSHLRGYSSYLVVRLGGREMLIVRDFLCCRFIQSGGRKNRGSEFFTIPVVNDNYRRVRFCLLDIFTNLTKLTRRLRELYFILLFSIIWENCFQFFCIGSAKSSLMNSSPIRI